MRHLLVLSDLHFGDGGPSDDFHADAQLQGFLDAHHKDYIVLAGDVAEMWQNKDVESLYSAHRTATRAISRRVKGLVRGNHDGRLESFAGRPYVDALVVDGILIMHGHQCDAMCHGPLRWVGKAASWIGRGLEYIHPKLDVWLGKLGTRLLHKGRRGSKKHYRKDALQLLDTDPALRGIVLGHTHKVDGTDRYWNCGTWTGNHRDYVRLPIADDPEVREYIIK